MSKRISTRNVNMLPDIARLEKLCQSIAVLDAILTPNLAHCWYTFNSRWAANEMIAAMNNEQGDHYFILFNPYGTIIKGYAHEAVMADSIHDQGRVWPGVLESVPDEFDSFCNEPAFMMEYTTFCIWRRYSDPTWQVGDIVYPDTKDPDGSEDLLFLLDDDPRTFKDWGDRQYGHPLSLKLVCSLYEYRPLIRDMIFGLNAGRSWSELQPCAAEIGYPVARHVSRRTRST